MWVTSGYEREGGPAVPVEALLKIAVVCECMCVYMWRGGHRNDSREKETCRRFDLWGSKHDNYYFPSKKLTTALRTSKHLFSLYYMIKQKMLAMSNTISCSSLTSKPVKLSASQTQKFKALVEMVSRNPQTISANIVETIWYTYALFFLRLISLKTTFRNSDGAFKDRGIQTVCRCLHFTGSLQITGCALV